MKDISAIRKDYLHESLDEKHVNDDPVKQFEAWFQEALTSEVAEPNAMTLSTVNEMNKPSSRIVLLKDVSEDGFTFFTNYQSQKGREIAQHPFVSLVFFWKELERQVRIEGTAAKISEAKSDAYFSSRPEASKIGAWASPQSQVINGREVIERNEASYAQQFSGKEITRPPHWGGYLIVPDKIEFWQGRPGRLHDRIMFSRIEKNPWKKERLAP